MDQSVEILFAGSLLNETPLAMVQQYQKQLLLNQAIINSGLLTQWQAAVNAYNINCSRDHDSGQPIPPPPVQLSCIQIQTTIENISASECKLTAVYTNSLIGSPCPQWVPPTPNGTFILGPAVGSGYFQVGYNDTELVGAVINYNGHVYTKEQYFSGLQLYYQSS